MSCEEFLLLQLCHRGNSDIFVVMLLKMFKDSYYPFFLIKFAKREH